MMNDNTKQENNIHPNKNNYFINKKPILMFTFFAVVAIFIFRNWVMNKYFWFWFMQRSLP